MDIRKGIMKEDRERIIKAVENMGDNKPCGTCAHRKIRAGVEYCDKDKPYFKDETFYCLEYKKRWPFNPRIPILK
jgi:hypothetical protein